MIKLRAETRHPLWRTPKHHMDTDAHDHVHWIELFYDLVHVVAVFVLGNYVSHHLDTTGFLVFAGLFCVMWMAWADISWFNSLYVSTDMYHRLYMTGLIITVMLCSASVETLSKSWTYFAVGHALNRFLIARLYWRARKVGDSTRQLPTEMARNYALMGALTLVSAFLPKPYNYYLFSIAFLWHVVWFAIPKIGVLRHQRNRPRLGHLSERFALLMLIVSGEGFFKLVLTLADKGIYKVAPDILVNNVIGAVAIFSICWIYYDFVANAKPKNDKPNTLFIWTLAHMFLMLGTVMIGVAMVGEVKVKFLEPYPTGYAFLGCFGLALYLLSLTVIQHTIETRIAHRFTLDWIRWFGIGMAILTYFIVPHVPSIIGNLLWGTALFSQILVPLYRGVRVLKSENDL